MSDNFDNYAEEVAPLFKLLRTPAFRFIIVCYNHYDLLRRLEQDLRQRFPERPFLKLDTAKTTYNKISESIQSINSGFFWLENFNDALKEERNSLGKETEEMAKRNEQRRHITAGLNLRRDRWATSPIALFVFVPMSTNELFARSIMEKMPDLWSFRSLILELRQDITLTTLTTAQPKLRETAPAISTLGGSTDPEKAAELHRLLEQLELTPADETGYLLTLYPQIVELQTELGLYSQALGTLSDWEGLASETEKATIQEKRGELFADSGDLSGALLAFQQALDGYQRADDKAKEAWIQIRLGDIHRALGEIDKAMKHFALALHIAETAPDSSPAIRDYTGLANERIGHALTELGDLQQALVAFDTFNKIEQGLVNSNPDEPRWKNNLAISYEKLGNTHSALGSLQQALEFYEQFNRLEKELHDAFPQNLEFKNSLAISYIKLGTFYRDQKGDKVKAKAYFEQCFTLYEALTKAYPAFVEFQHNFDEVKRALEDL